MNLIYKIFLGYCAYLFSIFLFFPAAITLAACNKTILFCIQNYNFYAFRLGFWSVFSTPAHIIGGLIIGPALIIITWWLLDFFIHAQKSFLRFITTIFLTTFFFRFILSPIKGIIDDCLILKECSIKLFPQYFYQGIEEILRLGGNFMIFYIIWPVVLIIFIAILHKFLSIFSRSISHI